jgi:hypothetical protein
MRKEDASSYLIFETRSLELHDNRQNKERRMTTEFLFYVCAVLLNAESMPQEKFDTRVGNCVELGELSIDYGHDPLMVISIAHTESRFNKEAVSHAGAVGIMQVMPRFFCPKTGLCDHTQAGLYAWRYWKSRYESRKDALCGYYSGRRCKNNHAGTGYARLVLQKYVSIKSL